MVSIPGSHCGTGIRLPHKKHFPGKRSPRNRAFILACCAICAHAEAETPEAYRLPLFKPDFEYRESKKKNDLYSEEQTREALPEVWRDVKRLEKFPDNLSDSIQLHRSVPDGAGGMIDFTFPPSPADLKALEKICTLLPAKQMLESVKKGRYKGKKTTIFLHGEVGNILKEYYKRYRVTGDRKYLDEIIGYAGVVDWMLEHTPRNFLSTSSLKELTPAEQKQMTEDPVAAFPDEPSAAMMFRAHALSAWLLLEAVENRAIAEKEKRSDVELAYRHVKLLVKYLESAVSGPDFRDQLGKGFKDRSGENTRRIAEEFNIPMRAAQFIEHEGWNRTWDYCAVLALTATAIDHLERLNLSTPSSKLGKTADLYQKILRAAVDTFQRENTCIVREGIPYIFHQYIANRDNLPGTKPEVFRLGFPIYEGEDTGHCGSGARNFSMIWDAGDRDRFGVSVALLAAYGNGYALYLNSPTSTKGGKPWPGARIEGPWSIAARGVNSKPAPSINPHYYRLAPFSPHVIAAMQQYLPRESKKSRNQKIKNRQCVNVTEPGNLDRLYAAYLYSLWKERRDHAADPDFRRR